MRIALRFMVLASSLVFIGAGCLSLTDSETKATGPAGVFTSVDSGSSWKQTSALPTKDGVTVLSQVSVYRFFNDPQDPHALYWASRGNGLFFSYDDGVTWQHAKGELSTGFVYATQVDPSDKCLLYATNGSRIYRSDDCSRSWHDVHKEDRASARVATLLVDPFGSHTLYAGKINGDILRSTNHGETWDVIARLTGQEIETILADPVQKGLFYVGTRKGGLYRSSDAGETFERLDQPLTLFSKALEYRRLYVHPTKGNVLYWTSTFGILKSADGGNSWSALPLITSPGSVDIFGFGVDPKNDNSIFYTTFNNARSTFYHSLDGGKTWSTEKLPSGQIPSVLRVDPAGTGAITMGFTIQS